MNSSNRNFVVEFLRSANDELRYSDRTVAAYQHDLDQFSAFLKGKPILRATSNDVASFISQMLESGLSPISVRRKLSSIKSLFGFLLSEEAIQHDPTRFLHGPKAFKPVVRPVTQAEVEAILAAITTDTPLGLRNRAMILTAYGSGIRVSELTDLNIRDLNFEHRYAKVTLGKGKKDRYVPLNAREIDSLRAYIEKGRPSLMRGAPNPESDRLFVANRGQKITRQRIWQIFASLGKACLGRKTSPHKFRHAFVTDTIHGGAQPRVVQGMVGHSHLSSTMTYMHSSIERVRKHYLASHPLALKKGGKKDA